MTLFVENSVQATLSMDFIFIKNSIFKKQKLLLHFLDPKKIEVKCGDILCKNRSFIYFDWNKIFKVESKKHY